MTRSGIGISSGHLPGDLSYPRSQLGWLKHFCIRAQRDQSRRHLAWPIHAQTQYLPTIRITFGRRKPLGLAHRCGAGELGEYVKSGWSDAERDLHALRISFVGGRRLGPIGARSKPASALESLVGHDRTA